MKSPTWTPRLVAADGSFAPVRDEAIAEKVARVFPHHMPSMSRATPQRKRELSTAKAVIAGAVPLSIDDLIERCGRTRMLILNSAARDIAGIADLVVADTIRAGVGNPYRATKPAHIERAMRLHRDIGRILEYGRMLASENGERD
jgi:hypothetical protein